MATLSRAQVREVDRRAIHEYGMSGLVLMENAGRGTTDVLCELLPKPPALPGGRATSRTAFPNPLVTIVCGKGNNGGDGFVMARIWICAAFRSKCCCWLIRMNSPAMQRQISPSSRTRAWRSNCLRTVGYRQIRSCYDRIGMVGRCHLGNRRGRRTEISLRRGDRSDKRQRQADSGG